MADHKNNQIAQARNKSNNLVKYKSKEHNKMVQVTMDLPPELSRKKDIMMYFKMRKKLKISEMSLPIQVDKSIVLKELDMLNKYCEVFLGKYPEVNLRVSGVENKPFFYVGHKEDGEIHYKYLSKKTNLNTIIIQANRKYISKLKSIISCEILAIKGNKAYDFTKKYVVYDEMNPRLRKYVIPLLCSPQFTIDCWENTIWKTNDFMEDNKVYETNRGEMVRSKSEKMIADLLYTRENIEYVYEGGLYFDGYQKYVYPDFVILNKRTGKISFLEHAGMLDNQVYANDFVRKINEYAVEDLIVGKDLFITAETQQYKYNSVAIKKVVDYICK